MKKLILIIPLVATVIVAATVPSPSPPLPLGSVTLDWAASANDTNPIDPLNYILEWGTTNGVYSSSTNVGTNLSATITNLAPATYYFVAVAEDTNTGLISPYSNPTNWTPAVIPLPPVITKRIVNAQ